MDFVFVFGPPAVGKMTVGRAVCDLTGFKLFHNHLSIEPILEVFEFGSPPFFRLVAELRRRVIEEAVLADLSGLVFTFVWPLDDAGDARLVSSLVDIVDAGGGTVHFVELAAEFDVRRQRNASELRREHKRVHRDVELSERILHESQGMLLNTTVGSALPEAAASVVDGRSYLRIDNTDLEPEDVARQMVEKLGLPTLN